MTYQAINKIDIGPFIRQNAPNVIGIASFFSNASYSLFPWEVPRIQAVLNTTDNNGIVTTILETNSSWLASDMTSYFSPSGNTGGAPAGNWYDMPNENLQRPLYPLNWNVPGGNLPSTFVPAIIQPPFNYPFYLEEAPAATVLLKPACSITPLPDYFLCAETPEDVVTTLACPQDPSLQYPNAISSILFASYGTPSGTCSAGSSSSANTFLVNQTCNSANSMSVVSAACLGKPTCSLNVSNAAFGGDPCDKVVKHFSVAVACNSSVPGNATSSRWLIDFGQEFSGGVNLTFPFPQSNVDATASDAGVQVEVILGEQVDQVNGGVVSPLRTGNKYDSVWTLSATNASLNKNIHHHEMIQFRFAEIRNSPVPITSENTFAWVVQHPFAGGTGLNSYEIPCATSQPMYSFTFNGLTPPPNRQDLLRWSSDLPGLDAVLDMTAYSSLATAVDINVDSRTRQRDLCHIDAAITAEEQYYTFSPNDYGLQRRTARNSFANDSGIWTSWMEFKNSGALLGYMDGLYTGDLRLLNDVWSDSDDSVVTEDGLYNTLQLYAGVRFFNLSGSGLLHFPANCGAVGTDFHCDPLADWPTNTRDGYSVSADNSEDAIRNGLGAITLRAVAKAATWLGKTAAAARYDAMADSIVSSLRQLLRYNGTEAYAVDGLVGASSNHSAIHSTFYLAAAGVADGNTTLANMLAANLIRRDTEGSSCMSGRWLVDGLFRLGREGGSASAADFAVQLLSRTTYPSWGNMILNNATISIEAWAVNDKWNTDFGHPWCASPAFLIPQNVLGLRPRDIAWSSFEIVPQLSLVTSISASVPSRNGYMDLILSAVSGNVTLSFTVLPSTAAKVCLPLAGTAEQQDATLRNAASDQLFLDGNLVSSPYIFGRFLCVADAFSVLPGSHVVNRITA
jgi:Galactose binding lectin domain/Bacterial alpha-L-rhamnosidase 6 hairpin glycosidase domain